MANADPKHNYYADLGVSPNADETEIRKAFRQLALKCHPDRNPGRETEFVKKFQNIQAAHEILSDAAQRAKYDAERRKYRGINIPSQGFAPNTPRNRPPPQPQRPSYHTTPTGSYYRPPPPKPTAQRPPPPQQNATYTNGADRFTSRNFRPPPTAQQSQPRPSERANVFTAWQKMKQPRAEESRAQNAGYPPPPPPPPPPPNGNANNPNGAPFGRSASTRTPSKKGFDPCTPGGDEGQARSSYRSTYERPVPSPPQTADPLKHFKEQMEDKAPHVPFSEANRVRTPYSSKTGERTSMFAESVGVGRSASVRNSPTHRNGASGDAGSFSDSGRKQRKSFAGPSPSPFPHMYVSSSDEESDEEPFRPAQPKRGGGPPKGPLNGNHGKPTSSPFSPTFPGPPHNARPDNTPTNFKSKSEESINMKFSPSDWHGTFQGSPDYFTPKMQKGTSSKGKTSPSRGRSAHRAASDRNPFATANQQASPTTQFPPPPVNHMPPPPAPVPPPPPLNNHTAFPNPSASVPQPTAKFTQEEWAEKFNEPSWVFPQNTKDRSPRRGSTATKRPKPAGRKASAPPNAPNGGAQTEGPKAKFQASAHDETSGDDDAMDIDSDSPPAEKPRRVSVGANQTYKPGNPIKFSPSSRTAPSSPQRRQNGRARAGTLPNGAAASSTPTAEKRSSSGLEGLAGLKNVEPFMPSTNGGLSGLGELGDTLPFKSQPSTSHPTKPNTAQKLRYPVVPIAPQPPASLDEASTKTYLTAMGRYCKSYREYSKTLTRHFAARDAELEDLEEGFTLQRGEATRKTGFASYLRRVEEDEKTLETWRVAMDMHRAALRRCEEVRNKTLRFS